MSLHTKMAAAQKAIGAMKPDGKAKIKTKTGAEYSYEYLTEGALMAAVKKQLSAASVAIYVSCEKQWEEAGATRTELLVTFADAETGETFSVKGQGAGTDMGDKGVYKAQTGALRYVLWKTFLIPSGDEPDAEHVQRRETLTEGAAVQASAAPSANAALNSQEPERPQRTQAQNRKFNATLKELNDLDGQDWKAKAKAYCVAEFGKESSTELNIDEMSTVIDEFEGQRLSLLAAREEATREAEALPFG